MDLDVLPPEKPSPMRHVSRSSAVTPQSRSHIPPPPTPPRFSDMPAYQQQQQQQQREQQLQLQLQQVCPSPSAYLLD